jgi:hypothetical protein
MWISECVGINRTEGENVIDEGGKLSKAHQLLGLAHNKSDRPWGIKPGCTRIILGLSQRNFFDVVVVGVRILTTEVMRERRCALIRRRMSRGVDGPFWLDKMGLARAIRKWVAELGDLGG